jgi:hypothetical protein
MPIFENFWPSQTTSVTEPREVAVAFHVKHVAEFIHTCKVLVGNSEDNRRDGRFKNNFDGILQLWVFKIQLVCLFVFLTLQPIVAVLSHPGSRL